MVKDNSSGSAGDIFGFMWNDANSNMFLIVSTDHGQTWVNKANSTGNFGDPNKVIALTQDSQGQVHAISTSGVADSGYYLRIALTHDGGGHVSGFTIAKSISLPGHNNSGIEKRADIKLVTDNGGVETLVYSLGLTANNAQDLKVYMGKSSSLMPTAFTGISGTGSDTKVFDSCDYNCSGGYFQTHNHTALFAQNRASHDLYLFQGPIDGDYGYNDPSIASANTIYMTRLTSGASGWAVAATSTISNHNTNGITPELMSVASGTNYAWVMYIDPLNGIKFGRIGSSGSYDETAIASPFTTQSRNGWGVFTVAPDDSKIWAIWDTLAASTGGSPGGSPNAAEGYWNGTSWTIYSDAGASDSMGMAGISGWNNGVAAILFNGAVGPQTYRQPTAATIWTN